MVIALPVNIYYPALNAIKEDLNTTTENMNFTVTVYIIAQALAPALWGPLADRTGRRPMFLLALLTYTISCIGLALAPSYPVLLVMRLMQSFGASPTVAIASGIIGDISTLSTRGTYFSLMSMTRHVMTTTAPMIGGVIAQKLTWRWIWWIMAIAGGIMVMLMFFFVPETLRSLVGNGSGYANPTPIQWWRRRRYLKRQQQSQQADDPCQPPIPDTATATNIPTTKSRKRINPFKSLIFLKEPDVMCALVFGGLCFGTQQSFMVTTANVLANVYHLSVMNVGLCFIVGGVGSFLGALTAGRMVDFEYRRVAIEFCGHVPDKGEISHDFPIFKARLRYPLCAAIIMQAAVMTFGWCVHTIQPLPVPLAMLFIFCFTHTGIFSTIQTLAVDLFPEDSSSITATNNLVRCSLAAIATATVELGIQSIGVQWTCFTISMILIVSNILPIILIKYGNRWRIKRIDKKDTNTKKSNVLPA
ncbi:hypothetical protein O0I10_003475 [Lichtheimia ornata]|uniref:Major facilitator superfamily (MFS) profile domain-containing protein n=1 Tax=Lichtheimia ornata TaxID=688661 RepID=A0AAD7Y2I7_9FUNG|nr:uncharacterized protein O0I10_003475 [Lichtheimia ornata]KAJ8660832.1 hypothetical protein O0I10_003475 [Lichtheimia ornata]